MKLTIIGGTGLIGSKLVTRLREQGHEAVPAAPNTGVNTLTGEGLPYLLDEYDAVINGVAEHRRRELPTRGTIVNFVR